jgi:hypothetical protein
LGQENEILFICIAIFLSPIFLSAFPPGRDRFNRRTLGGGIWFQFGLRRFIFIAAFCRVVLLSRIRRQLTAGKLGTKMIDMTDPTPSRRRLQFSLRTLLVFVTLCAIPCSWLAVEMFVMALGSSSRALFPEMTKRSRNVPRMA